MSRMPSCQVSIEHDGRAIISHRTTKSNTFLDMCGIIQKTRIA